MNEPRGCSAGTKRRRRTSGTDPPAAIGRAPIPGTPGAAITVGARRVQLQQVVHRADQRPLLPHRRPAAPEELAEAAGVFDLAEDRLDDRLPPRVHRAPGQGPQLPGHPFATGQVRGRAPARRGREPLAMLLPAGGDVGVDPPSLQRVHVRPPSNTPHPPAPAVGRCCSVRPIAVTCGSSCAHVRGHRRHVLRHDHLRVRVHRHLRVVALDEAVGASSGSSTPDR